MVRQLADEFTVQIDGEDAALLTLFLGVDDAVTGQPVGVNAKQVDIFPGLGGEDGLVAVALRVVDTRLAVGFLVGLEKNDLVVW